MTITAQSRLNVLDTPILAPGHCVLCGSVGGDGRKFIDFGKSIQWFGVVYFCTECFREFAEAAGFIPVADFDKLHNSLRELQIKYDQMEAKYKPVADVLASLGNASSGSVSMPSYIDNLPSTIDEPETDTEVATGGESETNKPDNVERSDDLFDDSDFE